jgi:hypothetical protein
MADVAEYMNDRKCYHYGDNTSSPFFSLRSVVGVSIEITSITCRFEEDIPMEITNHLMNEVKVLWVQTTRTVGECVQELRCPDM